MLFAVAQRELELAGEQEVPVQRVVAIHADPTVERDLRGFPTAAPRAGRNRAA